MAKKRMGLALAIALMIMPVLSGIGYAATVDVLWYSFGDASYESSMMTNVAGQAGSWGSGLTWNVTFFHPSDTPDFTNYNVLVTQSFDFGGLDYSGIINNQAAIEAARGSRTFISGQDADFHAVYDFTDLNGPAGFLINAIDWAASGTGLGIVALSDGYSGTGSEWFVQNGSFLKSELDGYTQYFQEESVIIPAATAGYPVNAGLTSDGLSNWGTSAHSGFTNPTPGYLSINDAGTHPEFVVTILTEGEAGGGTSGGGTTVPEPGTLILLVAGLVGLVPFRNKMRK